MAKLKRSQILPSTTELQDTPKVRVWADKLTFFLDTTVRKIASIPFNQSESVDVADTGGVGVEFTVTHHLGRVPNGYIVTKKDKAVDVFTSTGGTDWTTTAIYLKASIANAAITVTVF